MFFFDPNYLLFMIPGLLLMLWAQNKVKSAYAKYSKIPNDERMTGAQVARRILDANGLYDVAIEAIPGELSDHYDPRKRTLGLSQSVYGQASIAAMGIAAHEVGHAIQHAKAYAPLQLRTAIVPLVSIGSNLGIFVLLAGLFLSLTTLAWVGVGLFALSTVFALVTLPVEFDASRRAKQQLAHLGITDGGAGQGIETEGVRRMLDAAAWTYVASFAASLLTLLYYVTLIGRTSRD
ncbi:MAG: zinc metallopeptidase [Thermomicrobiales bacterium]|nr:zinc metallopeptidase [Thermomicrobiales bacterium]